MAEKTGNALTREPAPGGTGCFWHVGCLPLKYLTLPESGDFRPRPAAYFRASGQSYLHHCISPVNIQFT